MVDRPPRSQEPPLTVAAIARLETVATKGSSAYERLAAGTFILAILARARWSDFNRTINIILDFHSETPSYDGSDYVEFQAHGQAQVAATAHGGSGLLHFRAAMV